MLPGPECPCGAHSLRLARCYTTPPPGEVRSRKENYARELWHCHVCHHYVNRHGLDTSTFYNAAYAEGVYGARMRETFERIVALPPEKSDNVARVRRVIAAAGEHFSSPRPCTILDVGAGLCVFLHALQKHAWQCMALDPDAKAVGHARDVAGVAALHADFLCDDVPALLSAAKQPTHFDCITFNKVLEHVQNPVLMLQKAQALLNSDGMIYVELPDGENASFDAEGLDREEFHLEHWHIFSLASACLVIQQAGFTVQSIQRLREPSGKYTLWIAARQVSTGLNLKH